MSDINLKSFEEVKEAMQMYDNMQEAYNTYLAMMGYHFENFQTASGSSNVNLSDMNISTLGAVYAKQSCNVSRDF